ncbi:unnamed protein product [Nippostrongylus brasiliensis]|uniref:Uncharacterized protein n=1 Tax=Nippostrongylus brasiliensis TaxID=27835 RepID=A0A0N4XQN1_NIPBR|nr:unnamed protein product [Nippostrongylus brasiliensis]
MVNRSIPPTPITSTSPLERNFCQDRAVMSGYVDFASGVGMVHSSSHILPVTVMSSMESP